MSNARSAACWPVSVATNELYCCWSRCPDLRAAYPIACSSEFAALAWAKAAIARIGSDRWVSGVTCTISLWYPTMSSMITPYRTTTSLIEMPWPLVT